MTFPNPLLTGVVDMNLGPFTCKAYYLLTTEQRSLLATPQYTLKWDGGRKPTLLTSLNHPVSEHPKR